MPKPLPDYDTFNIDELTPFSKIELIAIDIDGTLLRTNETELSTTFLDYFGRLKYHGNRVRVTIATGRTFTGTKPLLNKMSIFKDTPLILYNGGIVLNGDYGVIRKDEISFDSLRKVIKISSDYNVQVLAYSCNWLGGNGPIEHAFGWSSNNRPKLEYNKMPVEWLEWNNRECSVTPSAIVIHTNGQTEVISKICSCLIEIDDISFSLGGTSYIEVRSKKTNKGVALEYVADKLNLKKHQVLAIGDNDNDAEMLSWAGIGIAVDSASELALKNSDYKARGVIEGAIQVLKLVRESKRLLSNEKNTIDRPT